MESIVLKVHVGVILNMLLCPSMRTSQAQTNICPSFFVRNCVCVGTKHAHTNVPYVVYVCLVYIMISCVII